MRQRIEHNVDAEWEGVFFGDFAEVVGIEGFLLPAVAEVVVEAKGRSRGAFGEIHEILVLANKPTRRGVGAFARMRR